MVWLLAALAGILFVEVLIRLPFFATLARFQGLTTRILKVLRSDRISDHWKERVLPRYAGQMLGATLQIGGILAAAFVGIGCVMGIAGLIGVDLLGFSLSWIGIVFMTFVALGYAKLRSRLVPV
jgi:hypothetical protein